MQWVQSRQTLTRWSYFHSNATYTGTPCLTGVSLCLLGTDFARTPLSKARSGCPSGRKALIRRPTLGDPLKRSNFRQISSRRLPTPTIRVRVGLARQPLPDVILMTSKWVVVMVAEISSGQTKGGQRYVSTLELKQWQNICWRFLKDQETKPGAKVKKTVADEHNISKAAVNPGDAN